MANDGSFQRRTVDIDVRGEELYRSALAIILYHDPAYTRIISYTYIIIIIIPGT